MAFLVFFFPFLFSLISWTSRIVSQAQTRWDSQHDGYLTGGENQVVRLFGRLLSLAPDQMGWWSADEGGWGGEAEDERLSACFGDGGWLGGSGVHDVLTGK